MVRRIVLDTNVLVSFMTDRSTTQQKATAELIQLAERREVELILHQVVITELVFVLLKIYGLPLVRVSEIVRYTLGMPGFIMHEEVPWSRVLDIWPRAQLGFVDAILASVAATSKCDGVATFDRPFSNGLRKLGIETYWP